MSEILIEATSVSKKFCTSLRASLWYGLRDLGAEMLGRRHPGHGELRQDEFWAIDNVSFTLRRGECLGLVGRNGAGKTTLLRMLNGLIRPDAGSIVMRGKTGAIIALGAGFNPVLTGRENIRINAAILGMNKIELDDRTEEIIAFSELGEFIDMPVRHYSSGMSMRLGFSIAVAIDPDILLLDEVLAVGDAAFRFKCHRRIQEMMKAAAVVFVSHDMAHVSRISSRVLVLDGGRPTFLGEPAAGVDVYRALNEAATDPEQGFVTLKAPIRSFGAELDRLTIHPSDSLTIRFVFDSTETIDNVAIRINVFNLAGDYAADNVIESRELGLHVSAGTNSWQLKVDAVPLKAGRYQFSFSMADDSGDFLAVSHKCHLLEVAGGHLGTVADCQIKISALPRT